MKLCAFQFHIDHHSQGNEGMVQETDGKNENKEQTYYKDERMNTERQ